MKKTKEEAAKTRQNIINAATQLFKQKGYEATSLVEICKEANLSRGAMYWYFDNKDILYKEIIRDLLKDMYQHKTAIAYNENLSTVDRLVELLMLPILYVEDYRLVTYTSDLVKHHPQFLDLIPEIQEAKQKLYDLMKELLVSSNDIHNLKLDDSLDVINETLYFLFEGLYFDGVENKSITKNRIKVIVLNLLKANSRTD